MGGEGRSATPGAPVHYLCELKIDGLAHQPPLRARRARLGRDPRRRPRRRGRHRERASASRGIPQRLAGTGHPALVEVRGEVFFHVADFESLNALAGSRMGDRARSPTRATRASGVAPRRRREGKNAPAARRGCIERLSRACACCVHGIGAWPDPPVATQSEVYALLASLGAADEPVLPRRRHASTAADEFIAALRRAPPRRRARDRRHRRQGRRARPARRARRHQPRAALGDRLQVPARAGATRSCSTSWSRSVAPAARRRSR